MLFSDFPINVTVWVFKNMVSCNDDFFDVPTTWEKDTKTVTFFTEESFTGLEQFTVSALCAVGRGNGYFKPGTGVFAKFSLSQHEY